MAAFVVEPTSVIEFVGDVLVVPDVALARIGGYLIAGTNAADCNETLALRRPLIGIDAVLQVTHHLGLTAVHVQDANLRPRGFSPCSYGRIFSSSGVARR